MFCIPLASYSRCRWWLWVGAP